MNEKWLVITDEVKDGRRLLLTIRGPQNYLPDTGHYSTKFKQWVKQTCPDGSRITFAIEPTHYMPLPNSPK